MLSKEQQRIVNAIKRLYDSISWEELDLSQFRKRASSKRKPRRQPSGTDTNCKDIESLSLMRHYLHALFDSRITDILQNNMQEAEYNRNKYTIK